MLPYAASLKKRRKIYNPFFHLLGLLKEDMELFDALSNLISERKEIESNFSSNLLRIANALHVDALDPEREIFFKVHNN